MAIPGSICVVIHSTCASHSSGYWMTNGRQGSRCCSAMMNLKKPSEGGQFLISDLFSAMTVISYVTVSETRSLGGTAECVDV